METIKVGIDLGTTNTLVSTIRKGKIKSLKFGKSEMLPSVLYIENDNIRVGEEAYSMGITDPDRRIKSSKTWMGDHNKYWEIDGKKITPTIAASEILKVVKANVIKKLKLSEDTIVEAVITVPAYFTSNQIDETRKAGENAGLKVSKITTEPMAAAIAYASETDLEESKKLFMVDIGGGTFDISVLEVDEVNNSYRNLAVEGDKRLGGDDFDESIFNYFIEIVEEDLEIDLSTLEKSNLSYNEYHQMRSRLLYEAEEAKKSLSEDDEVEIEILNFFTYNGEEYHFETTLTKEDFNKICEPLYDRVLNTIDNLMKKENFKTDDIGRVILVGGTCYISEIKNRVEKYFNQDVFTDMDLSTMVVTGACILANNQDGVQRQIDIKDIISHSLGIEVLTPQGAQLEKLLIKNSVYPITKSKIFTTVFDNQESVDINVYEGEYENDINRNEFYGSVTLEGIEKAPKGQPEIEISFSFDENRILEVTATDLKTGAKKQTKMKKGEKIINRAQDPMDLMVLIDTSGSMGGSDIINAKKACKNLVNNIIDLNVHRLGLVSFSSTAEKLSDLTSNKENLLNIIDGIQTRGTTNMRDAISLATDMLKNSTNNKAMIILTDGHPDIPERTKENSKTAKENDIRVITIGSGNHADYSLLKQISSKQGETHDAYKISEMNKLTETFKTIMNSLSRC